MVKNLVIALLLIFITAIPAHAVIELDTDANDAIDLVYGGTNATTAEDARTNLGLAIGVNVQAYSAGLDAWAFWTDPNKTALLVWDDVTGAFATYVPTPWSITYSGAASALADLALGAQYTILQSGGPAAAPTWTGTLNFDPFVLPNGTNPTVDATGETALDTDGANETGDMTLRIFDGTNVVAMGRKLHCIQWTVYKPQDLADAQRDLFPIWENNTGMVFTILEIRGRSDISTNFTVEVVTETDWSAPATIDAVTVFTAGTSMYWGCEGPNCATPTAITDPTVAHGECLTINFHDTDVPAIVKGTICGWFNAAVD